jgi:16S rRNA (uracil1498-N3)-methyltransferase
MAGRRPPRLWIESGLAAGGVAPLTAGQAHHLRAVLRLPLGAAVAAFNAADGEWLCRIVESGGRIALRVVECLQPPVAAQAAPWLLFAPVKRGRLDWLVEKATELGAAALLPVWTRHTQNERLNLDRLRVHAIAAAEQSERLSIPELTGPRPLAAVLADWPAERRLFVCDETGAGAAAAGALAQQGGAPCAFLTGPEGGFDASELDAFDKFSFVTRVGLGPRVLRADTAAVAVLAVYQAVAGDWRHTRFR